MPGRGRRPRRPDVDGVCEFGGARAIKVRDHHPRALGDEGPGDRGADPAGAAGDQRPLAGEPTARTPLTTLSSHLRTPRLPFRRRPAAGARLA